jgi:hypothetical protein
MHDQNKLLSQQTNVEEIYVLKGVSKLGSVVPANLLPEKL